MARGATRRVDLMAPGTARRLGLIAPGTPRRLGLIAPGTARRLGLIAPGAARRLGLIAPGTARRLGLIAPGTARRLGLIARTALLCLAVCALLASAASAARAPIQRASMADIESQVMCVTCGIPLELAVSPQADRERAGIQVMIDEGMTAAQIKRALVVQLGPGVLALPPRKGFDLVVYVVPVLVILGLLVALFVGLRRWRRRARSEQDPDPAASVAELGLLDSTRLEQDLARFDA
jgi:cytochrome c-type biogenesis protein CcmH